MPDLAAALRRRRLRAGLTQTEFARRLCVGEGTVRAWEAGRKRPQARYRTSIALVLAVAAADSSAWLPATEAAKLAGITRHAVYMAIARGRLQSRVDGGKVLVRKDEARARWVRLADPLADRVRLPEEAEEQQP